MDHYCMRLKHWNRTLRINTSNISYIMLDGIKSRLDFEWIGTSYCAELTGKCGHFMGIDQIYLENKRLWFNNIDNFAILCLRSWDEWVNEDRVLKYNDANVQIQKGLMKQHSTLAKNKRGKRPFLPIFIRIIRLNCIVSMENQWRHPNQRNQMQINRIHGHQHRPKKHRRPKNRPPAQPPRLPQHHLEAVHRSNRRLLPPPLPLPSPPQLP